MATIKLDAIRQEALVPIRLKMTDGKYAELQDYLAFFNETHGSDVELPTLLPHLIGAFLAEDRAFARWRAGRQSQAAPRALKKTGKKRQSPVIATDIAENKNTETEHSRLT